MQLCWGRGGSLSVEDQDTTKLTHSSRVSGPQPHSRSEAGRTKGSCMEAPLSSVCPGLVGGPCDVLCLSGPREVGAVREKNIYYII